MTYYALSALVNWITSLALGAYLIVTRGRHAPSRLFGLWCLSVGGWSFGYYFWQRAPTAESALVWTKVLMAFAIIIPVFILHFTVQFLHIFPKKRRLIIAYYLVSLLYLATDIWGGTFISKVEPELGFRHWPRPGLFFHPYLAMFLSSVAYSHYLLWKEMRITSAQRRLQILYVFWGVLIAFSGGSTNFPLWYGIPIPPIGNGLVIVYVIAVTYAIVRHRLMDITIAVTRTAILIGVYALVLLIPAVLATVFRPSLTAVLGPRWWLVPQGVFATLALAGPFVYLFFQRRAEANILSEQRRYQATLMNAARGMVKIRDLKRLLRLIAYLLTRSMKLAHAEIFIWDQKASQYVQPAYHLKGKRESPVAVVPMEDAVVTRLLDDRAALVTEELTTRPEETGRAQILSRLRDLKAAVIVPSFINERLIGFVVLGQKRNGRMFSQDDLNVLQTLASQAALAIENARFFEELQNTQAQLFQSEKMAALGRMGAGMSHQLHNRFQALLKNSGDLLHIELPKMLKQPDWTPEQRQQLEKFVGSLQGIEREAGKGAEIVRKLVKYARLSPGDQLVDLHDVITEAIGMLQFTAKLETIDLVYDLPASLPKIRGNATFLQDIFFNLTDNAWQAIDAKHQELTAGRLPAQDGYKGIIAITASHVADKRKIKITVHDNGVGMTKEQLARLFEPFYSTKSSVGHGTGLGLFIVKKMVEEAHQGTIEAVSTYGVGTSFILHFPAVAQ